MTLQVIKGYQTGLYGYLENSAALKLEWKRFSVCENCVLSMYMKASYLVSNIVKREQAIYYSKIKNSLHNVTQELSFVISVQQCY